MRYLRERRPTAFLFCFYLAVVAGLSLSAPLRILAFLLLRSSLATAIMRCAHVIYPSLHGVRLFNGIIDKRRRTRLGFHNRRYPIFFVRQSTLMRLKRELRLNMHAMKAIAIIVVLLLVVVNALELLPAASAFQMYLSGGAVALSLVALIAILVGRGPSRDNRSAGAEAARPMPVTTRANRADAEIVSFLAMLQARGRLVDFLMDDINAHDDAQVGAAARVVHAGCKTALLEHFRISPVRAESEGSTVQVAAGYSPDEYRLLGKISGPAPFSGVLVHHGWKTDAVNLPRVLRSSTHRLPAIAPAEVELR